jgi:hypothetical protein
MDSTLQDLVATSTVNESSFESKNYGTGTPTVIRDCPAPDSFEYMPTRSVNFEGNTWEVIAWVYDNQKIPYAIVYEPQ